MDQQGFAHVQCSILGKHPAPLSPRWPGLVPLLVDEASPPFEHRVQVGQHAAEQQLEPRTMRQKVGSGHGRKGLGCRMRVGGDCDGFRGGHGREEITRRLG